MPSACQRSLCVAAKKAKLGIDPSGAELWRRAQSAMGILPELAMQLEAARRVATYESRSALAVHLAKRWTVDTVSAQKGETSVVATYALRVDGVDLALLRASIWPEGPDSVKTALIFSLQSDPGLPLALAAYPLVEHARKELTSEDVGVERILGVAALPGLCQWMVENKAWERINETTDLGHIDVHWIAARSACEAVARGLPQPGRAALTEKSYKEAEEAFKGIALEYAALEDVDAESTALSLAGGRLVGVHYRHDTSEEALTSSAGCTASYEFNTELVSHIDLDDTIAEHLDPTAHPAEGFPGRW